MHEWALAEAVITAALEIAEKEGLKEISEINIRIGELQQIEADIFEFALSQLKSDKLKNAKILINTAKAEFRCRVCGTKWFFEKNNVNEDTADAIHFIPGGAHTYIKCPNCRSPDLSLF